MVAAGNTALDGTVKNAIAGTGWTDTEGKQGRADIAVSETGQTLSFKKVQFPSDHKHKFTGTVNGAWVTYDLPRSGKNITVTYWYDNGSKKQKTLQFDGRRFSF